MEDVKQLMQLIHKRAEEIVHEELYKRIDQMPNLDQEHLCERHNMVMILDHGFGLESEKYCPECRQEDFDRFPLLQWAAFEQAVEEVISGLVEAQALDQEK